LDNLENEVKVVDDPQFPDGEELQANIPRNWKSGKNRRKIIHELYNFPVVVEGIVKIDTNYRVDKNSSSNEFANLDLHARLFDEDQRHALPVMSFEELSALHEDSLDEVENGYFLVTFPAAITDSIFLEEADWTMPIEEVLTNQDLMFNCLCELWTKAKIEGNQVPSAINVDRYDVRIFRSFKIV
jgi:hypothetical protein